MVDCVSEQVSFINLCFVLKVERVRHKNKDETCNGAESRIHSNQNMHRMIVNC